jgi:hypothetical protein
MPTRVYLSGSRVIIEKSGSSTLAIPQYRAKFQFFGDAPISDIEDYENAKFIDTVTSVTIEDSINKIQDSAGAFIGTNKQVQDYLTSIIFYSDSYITQKEPCTAANQLAMIAQNEEIKAELLSTRLTQEDSQEVLKKELKENNKLLRKIYQ